ncbi:TetR family transcriptional regulator [Massilia sp. B-10]|nr:TetR family transcriptional regulator [Massilia sp. B-10]
MEKLPPPPEEGRKSRSDGVQSRERLLLTAMRLFAEQGFARTSTREIALAHSTNIASISYYFGDSRPVPRRLH